SRGDRSPPGTCAHSPSGPPGPAAAGAPALVRCRVMSMARSARRQPRSAIARPAHATRPPRASRLPRSHARTSPAWSARPRDPAAGTPRARAPALDVGPEQAAGAVGKRFQAVVVKRGLAFLQVGHEQITDGTAGNLVAVDEFPGCALAGRAQFPQRG